MIAPQILVADENAGHAEKKGPGSDDGSAADVKDAEARQEAAQRELRQGNKNGASTVGWLLVVGTRFQCVQDRDRYTGHDQINDKDKLSQRTVDATKSVAVESKTAPQRKGRQ